MINAKVTRIDKKAGTVTLKDENGNTHISEQPNFVWSAKCGQIVQIKQSRLIGQTMLAIVKMD